jgi:hypothetical protein
MGGYECRRLTILHERESTKVKVNIPRLVEHPSL